MKYSTYFSQDAVAILQLNQILRKGNHTQDNPDKKKPLKWELMKVGKYVHPATVSVIAKILGLDKKFCWDWMMEFEEWSHDAAHLTHPTAYFEVTHIGYLEAALIYHKNHPFMIEHQLSPEDFIWEVVPILSNHDFEYRKAKNGTNQPSVGQVIVGNLKKMENAAHYLIYKTSYRGFQSLLHRWITIVNQPTIQTLWELPPYHQFMLQIDTPPKPHFLTEWLPDEIAPTENAMEHVWNYEVIPISQKQLLQLHKNNLKVIEIQGLSVIKHIELPFNNLHFYKKENQKIYFLIEECLICWDIEKQDFVKSEQQHAHTEFSEANESSYLSNTQYANVIVLNEIYDYPVIYTFDCARNYLWGEDKEGAGAVYAVNSGLVETMPHSTDVYPDEGVEYRYATLAGEIVKKRHEEDDDEYEEYQKLKKQAESQAKILKPDCFGFYKGDWLFYCENKLIYKNQIFLITELLATYTMFDDETNLLYIENPHFVQVFDLRDIHAPQMLFHHKCREDG